MKNEVPFHRLPCDPWVASSLLQKSIRRDLPQLAAQAAAEYAISRGRDVWRRLVTIAYEDVGCGDLDLVNRLVALATDPAEIKRRGGWSCIGFLKSLRPGLNWGREAGPRLIGHLLRLTPWRAPSVICRTPRSLSRHALPRGLRDIPSCC